MLDALADLRVLDRRLDAVRQACSCLRRGGVAATPARLQQGCEYVVIEAHWEGQAFVGRIAMTAWLRHHCPGIAQLDWTSVDRAYALALGTEAWAPRRLLPDPPGGWDTVTALRTETGVCAADGWQIAVAHEDATGQRYDVYFEAFPTGDSLARAVLPNWLAHSRVTLLVSLGRSQISMALLSRLAAGDLLLLQCARSELMLLDAGALRTICQVRVMKDKIELDDWSNSNDESEDDVPPSGADGWPMDADWSGRALDAEGANQAYGDGDGGERLVEASPENSVEEETYDDHDQYAEAGGDVVGSGSTGTGHDAFDDLPLTLTFVVDQLTMTIGELASLEAGATLPLRQGCLSRVGVHLAGRCVARGELVRFDDGLAIEIAAVLPAARGS